ncbi:putative N-acetylmannosamine-6-phosphate 2-epimerase [Corynebacterium uberis]|uniref:putative N-acetylmannosamine-6-phosphate 2-epimerase n=1 Tax=Corynebacterium uberis TaxID=2883169 RepID=UPI001D0AFA6C|nr:putative N-acetylmannosamine-6-phosphate 2-epimerase [Corynebacterium uberis]UDL74804.1 putative N-acetylmannosamine-6-phosphate 2-epimerase [Corynebacterium uberis]UDL77007.1 putative N-acetylmannosamine-6-phosphate 2-epimerase [Corynebacterium uberis]UDL79217.1 putative N-acetylmannosamine-6-phosphate 2-epimerase [Corynebacterium uberis]UDL81423.1 putative N-acetylmannosamine-6-phosphate 2-epimerase [Corynebacterium uberis]UDL83636.1 putative N-acetylmannosamine-6-phosphate 2-epimerase [C
MVARRAELCAAVSGRLIVSVQAPDGHPMRDTHTLTHVARACVAGGSPAIRCGGYGGLEDIRAIAAAVDVPVFGLTKEGTEGVYITPTVASVRAVAKAGAAVVCADATGRPRPDGAQLAEMVAAAHEAGALFMADCARPEDAGAAAAAGADIVSTTLAGYTPQRAATEGPDLECLRLARAAVGPEVFVIGEGRFHSPQDCAAGRAAGADAIIVGTAITDPAWITGHFAAGMDGIAPLRSGVVRGLGYRHSSDV